jgi:hypothetical protein
MITIASDPIALVHTLPANGLRCANPSGISFLVWHELTEIREFSRRRHGFVATICQRKMKWRIQSVRAVQELISFASSARF